MARKNSRARAKPRPRRLNSRITEAQKTASERTIARNQAQQKRVAEANAAEERRRKLNLPESGPLGPTRLEAKQPGVIQMQRGVDQDAIRRRDEALAQQRSGERNTTSIPTPGSGSITDPLVNPANYGRSAQQVFDQGGIGQDINGRTITLANLQKQAASLKTAGRGVYMGKVKGTIGRPKPAPVDEKGGQRYRPGQPIQYDSFVPIETLMAWLSDPVRVDEIKRKANKAGLNVQSYDDISKLWGSVLQMAAQTYTATGRKVTPWELIDLRGRHADPETGRPRKRTGKNITIEEIDPATARLEAEDLVKKLLGRRPNEDEIDAFIAKVQSLARQKPLVETFEQDVGFDDQPVQNTFSITSRTGGAESAKDQAEAELLDQLRRSPEYSNRQAAGFYGPLLFEALGSPID